MEYQRANLVALVLCDNTCYTKVVTLDDEVLLRESIVINEKAGTWLRPGTSWDQVKEIGQGLYKGHIYRVIGIYDRTNLNHLSSMLHHAKEATSSHAVGVDD